MKHDDLTSFWIEFGNWPADVAQERIPPFPRECGVTAATLDEALEFVHLGFYEDRELPPVITVTSGVERAPRPWAAHVPAPSGQPGIWHPAPFYTERTVVAEALWPPSEGWEPDDPHDDPPVPPASIAFCERLADVAPEIASLLAEHRGDNDGILPHVFMGRVTFWLVDEFVAGRRDPLIKVASWLEREYPDATGDVENLIAVSFLENLPWPPDPDAPAIEETLGPRLRKTLKEMQDWRPTS